MAPVSFQENQWHFGAIQPLEDGNWNDYFGNGKLFHVLKTLCCYRTSALHRGRPKPGPDVRRFFGGAQVQRPAAGQRLPGRMVTRILQPSGQRLHPGPHSPAAQRPASGQRDLRLLHQGPRFRAGGQGLDPAGG